MFGLPYIQRRCVHSPRGLLLMCDITLISILIFEEDALVHKYNYHSYSKKLSTHLVHKYGLF